jgi:hypothetical protein
VPAPPCGCSDDAPKIQAAMTKAASSGGCAQLFAGAYTINSAVTLVQNGCILGAPGVALHSTMTPNGDGVSSSIFFGPSATSGYSSTLAANSVGGAYTISVTANPSGSLPGWFSINNATYSLTTQFVRGLSSTGSGSYTLTIAQPISFPWAHLSGAAIVASTPIVGVTIDLKGAVICGSGNRVFEASCVNCNVGGYTVEPTCNGLFAAAAFHDIVSSCDVGSSNCTLHDIDIDGGYRHLGSGGPTAGVALESCTGCRISNVTVRNIGQNSANYGVFLVDDVDADVEGVHIYGAGDGIYIGTGPGASSVSHAARTSIRGGAVVSAAQYGVIIAGATETSITDLRISYSALDAIYHATGSASSQATGGPTKLLGVRSTGNGGPFLDLVTGDVVAENCTSLDDGLSNNPMTAITFNGAGTLTVTGGTFARTVDSVWYGIYSLGAGNGLITGGAVISTPPAHSIGASGGVVMHGSGLITLGDLFLIGAAQYGAYCFTGGKAHLTAGTGISTGIGTAWTPNACTVTDAHYTF